MRKLTLIPLFLLLGLVSLVPTPARAACKEGEWSFEMETKGESWLGDYGACSGGRYRCHSVCWDRWSTQCVGGVWVRKWVASSGCSKDHVCRAQTGWSGRHCDCCTPPSHNVCQGKACVKVFTSGTDECSAPAPNSPDCMHKACNNKNMLCEEVPGKGPNLCTVNEDCFHKECQGCACAKAPGKGPGAKPCTTLSPNSLECCAPPPPQCQCGPEPGDCGGGGCAAIERFQSWKCIPVGCQQPPANWSPCVLDPTCVVPAIPAWFQTARGDVAAAGGLVVNIPAASEVAPFSKPDFDKPLYKGPYFSVGEPVGAVFVGRDPVSFGDKGGTVSTKRWLAKDYPLSTTLADYDYGSFLIKWKPQITVSGGTLTGGKISGSSFAGKIVLVQGSLAVEDSDNLDQVAALILVEGTLNFRNDFYPPDSAILFISQGAVSVDPTVKIIRAAILTDDQMSVFGVSNAEPQPEEGLLLEGMYLANSSGGNFSLQRGRKDNKAPAVMFSYAPEIIVELTKSFGKARVTSWREVIGGKK